jgi:hypothetical protein
MGERLMGAAGVLPTVPTFTAGAPSITQLNQLSYAAQFLAVDDMRPSWTLFRHSSTQSISATTWTKVLFDHVAVDSDSVWSSPDAVIKTQGYYKLGASITMQTNANTGDMFTGAFLFTAGGSNPHFTTGTTEYFGFRGSKLGNTGAAAADNTVCLACPTQVVCYAGDKLAVAIYLNSGHTLSINNNGSYIQGRFACTFTGTWLRTGS